LPAAAGLRSENAAHRIAVWLDGPEGPQRGVFIPRRDTASSFNAVIGGRLFPGEHHLARFQVQERGNEVAVSMTTRDQTADARVRVTGAARLTGSDLFVDLKSASAFFRDAPVGYSARSSAASLDALELRAHAWQIEPADVITARSAFFEDPSRRKVVHGSAGIVTMRGAGSRWPAGSVPGQVRVPARVLLTR
jgi:hypothetical protein